MLIRLIRGLLHGRRPWSWGRHISCVRFLSGSLRPRLFSCSLGCSIFWIPPRLRRAAWALRSRARSGGWFRRLRTHICSCFLLQRSIIVCSKRSKKNMLSIFQKKCPMCRMKLEKGREYPSENGKKFCSESCRDAYKKGRNDHSSGHSCCA